MSETSITEIKNRADIRQVWCALGGTELRRGRGQAFWRQGDGYNVAVDPDRGNWYDFRDNVGGDVISLVETARKCSFKEAVDWLAEHVGLTIQASASGIGTMVPKQESQVRKQREHDLRWARYWKIAAEALAEWALEELPNTHPERLGLTALLNAVRLGELSLLTEYRKWRRRCPQLTHAMARAGRCADARLQRRLALWLMECDCG
jgi:hypothetical protein